VLGRIDELSAAHVFIFGVMAIKPLGPN
jgi:hypothetical protein